MNREGRINYEILKYIGQGKNTKEDDIVERVYKKFRFTNFFRMNKIYKIDVSKGLEKCKDKGYLYSPKPEHYKSVT